MAGFNQEFPERSNPFSFIEKLETNGGRETREEQERR